VADIRRPPSDKSLLTHHERVALLAALVAWRNQRRGRTQLSDTKAISAVVYGRREKSK